MLGLGGESGEWVRAHSSELFGLACLALAYAEMRHRGQAVNLQIRGCALHAQNVDKGFDRHVCHFKFGQEISATLWVEERIHGELGWASKRPGRGDPLLPPRRLRTA
jgi:hypothetical protein